MKLPTPEERLFGNERYKQGFRDGYLKRTHFMRRLKSLKEKSLFKQFGEYWDYIDYKISENKKR